MHDITVTHSPAETHALARGIAHDLSSGSVLALYGDLGSGKTCFVQGLAQALGVSVPVTSPTFTLVNEYRGSAHHLYHIDLYRLGNADEALAMGFEEYTESDGIAAIEWAERAESLLPPHTLHLRFRTLEDRGGREITITR